MASWQNLQAKLMELLNSNHVYYQPPASVQMVYPAIVYSKSNIRSRFANGNRYTNTTRYEVIVIDRLPDNEVIDKLLDLPYCSYDRNYKLDNLYHDVLTLYF